jgi:hypothetical protein
MLRKYVVQAAGEEEELATYLSRCTPDEGLRGVRVMSQAKTTTDHATIRRWAEKHGGRPSRVRNTGSKDDPGILRLDFGDRDESLEEISWEEFFEKFEENHLALLYQDQGDSRFNKLVDREKS